MSSERPAVRTLAFRRRRLPAVPHLDGDSWGNGGSSAGRRAAAPQLSSRPGRGLTCPCIGLPVHSHFDTKGVRWGGQEGLCGGRDLRVQKPPAGLPPKHSQATGRVKAGWGQASALGFLFQAPKFGAF